MAYDPLEELLYQENIHVPDGMMEDVEEHFKVFCDAVRLYLTRDPHHASLWKEYGWKDTAQHSKSKALRLCVDPPTHLDDALDGINYIVFTVRNVWHNREGE